MTAEEVSSDADRVGEQTSADRQATTRGVERRSLRRRFAPAGLTLGFGLGGFIDGIVLHQILRWHAAIPCTASALPPSCSVYNRRTSAAWRPTMR
jgi:uncharacterized membrane protein